MTRSLPSQRHMVDDGGDERRHKVMVVVHLHLDRVAGIARGAFGRRVGVGRVRPTPDAHVDVAGGALEAGRRGLGPFDDAAQAVVGVRVAVRATGQGVACTFAGRMLDRDPGLAVAARSR